MPTALDNGQRSPRKLLRAVLARLPFRANLFQLDAVPVDPRDIRWEVSSPTYRVYFWRRVGGGYHSEEFQLSGASDVREVLAWAERNRKAGRSRPTR
jgi:hypothetical protein